MLEKLSNESLRGVLDHIQTHFSDFLRLPLYKQKCIAERAVTQLVNKTFTTHMHIQIVNFIVIDVIAKASEHEKHSY